jgi:DNA (cytosine-5)-methyltransferase 1
MKYISLFSGIGGFDLGFDRAGMECVLQVEKDEKARAVLKHHWPDVPRMELVEDVTKDKIRELGIDSVDLICGGFPCQPHSTIGKRLASEDKRDLWEEYARIIHELKPRWVVAENVLGLLSSEDGRFFGRVLGDLAQSGYDAEWQVLSASAFGYPHKRERVIIVAYPNSFRSKANPDEKELRKQALYNGNGRHNRSESEPLIFCRKPTSRKMLPQPQGMGMANGLPDRLDKFRIGMLGNGIVPDLAEWIGRRIMTNA